jgi:hypothetical protein
LGSLDKNTFPSKGCPQQGNYFTEIFAKDYRTCLESNATTDDGMQYVAKQYGVEAQWKSYLDGSRQNNCAKDYYKLLQIVKTLSNEDYAGSALLKVYINMLQL